MTESFAKFDVDELVNCMHCGFCLPTCPTYQQTGLETHSPRGRISLMKAVAERELPLDEEFERNMYACLGCRACETACPAGVKYGQLIETAREVIEDGKKSRRRRPFMRDLVFNRFFNHPKRLRTAGHVLWAAQATGLQAFATKTGLVNILPREMAEMQVAVNRVASPMARQRRRALQVQADDSSRPVVGIFTGCIMDVLFYELNEAMAQMLTKAGCKVMVVPSQVCCGALHAHSGEKVGAIDLAKQNIAAFEASGVDVMVNNAGGCGAALKEYHHWLKDDPAWSARARAFVGAMRDVNELLAELPPLPFSKPLNVRVTYQDSCHLAHGQGVRKQPRDLIRAIPGVEYVEMTNADGCCGSAGIYNLTNFDMSMQILDDKMERARDTRADIVVTTNPGCLLQMKKGIERAGLMGRVEAVHILELLNRAL